MSFFHFRNARINYTDKGFGSAVVLIHGFPFSMDIWKIFSTAISKSHRVLCIDLPGFGKSDCIPEADGEHSMELFAETVYCLLQHREISRCVIAGHSMGGYVALSFAEKYPELLSGLCLFHSHPLPDSGKKKNEREVTIEAVRKDHLQVLKNFVPGLFAEENRTTFVKQITELVKKTSQADSTGIIAALNGMKNRNDKHDVLKNIKNPVLWILGKKDPVMDFHLLAPLFKLSLKITPVVLENSGHMGMVEAREKCEEEFMKWLSSMGA